MGISRHRKQNTAGAAAGTVAVFMLMAGTVLASQVAGTSSPTPSQPFIYTDWEQFTVEDGLPDDHVFAVRVQGNKVWIGTENGLARLDKVTGEMKSWTEADGLPWRVISALDFDPKTGDLWLGLFGGGLARFSGGRFDHFHQLNSGLVNDVVYGVAVVGDDVWAATTAGASRYDTVTGEWAIFNEKNAPMEEIWNYGVTHGDGKVFLAVWGSGILEYDIAGDRWKDYLDPDGEMEIDLYRDDGIVHVITTGASHVDGTLWVGTYFGANRYDGRHWRGYYAHDSGLPSDFVNAVKGRSDSEAWFSTDKGLGVLVDFETDTWVTYNRDPERAAGRAVVQRGAEVLETVETGLSLPHDYVLWVELDGNDAWVGTAKGLGRAFGREYFAGLRPQTSPAVEVASTDATRGISPEEDEAGDTKDPPGKAPASGEAGLLASRGKPEAVDGTTGTPDDETTELLEQIESAPPYGAPAFPLRKDRNYADTPAELEPYGAVKPYKEHFIEQMEYSGPGRGLPEPEDLESVKLGFIGPIEPTVSVATGGASRDEDLGVQMLNGSRLAIEEANARGGYTRRDLPFELVVSNDNGLWGASGNEIIKQAYEDRVWGILGTIDGANSHIAIRVALKAEVVMVNTGDTDPTFVETNIPWVVRVIGDDRRQGYLLVDYLYRKLERQRVGIIRASSRYGRFGVREIKDGSRRLGRPVPVEMAYKVGIEDFSLHLDRLEGAGIDAVVHWGDGADGARILNQMRARGMTQPFLGCDRTVSDEFVDIAGPNAEGVMAGFSWNPQRRDERLSAFRERYRVRFGTEPDTFAAHAFDGMNMLISAVQAAGLNRARIRDMLAHRRQPWPGVTGDIELSAALDDIGEVYLARFENGKWRYLSRQDLAIPGAPVAPAVSDARDAPESTHRDDPAHAGGHTRDAGAGAASHRVPHFDANRHQVTYAGPQEIETPGAAGEEVRIGWFGPDDPDDPVGGDPWLAASLAVEEANAAGGHDGRPFRLLPAWSENPWGTGVAGVTRLVYDEEVVAMIGAVDGASMHLAEQVVAKARLPLLNPVSTDKSVNMANVAWTFSFLPADDEQARALAAAVRTAAGESPVMVVSATDHDSRATMDEMGKALERAEVVVSRHLEIEPGTVHLDELLDVVVEVEPAALLIIAGSGDGARLAQALGKRDIDIAVFGGATMGRRQFLDIAGAAADGAVFPQLCELGELSENFTRAFRIRHSREADCATVQAYDATRLLIEAVHRAGPTRAAVRDELENMAPWSGAGGTVEWNGLGENRRTVRLATIRNGQVEATETD